ncbi:conserved exported hypothetical protein [Hyella patelloides LEGE 07179]|uniref:Uncharacterized protein n=1 Tax=Hyella patelloides LEGE 07179 TaxID=945734 RepID=A0A563VVB3_9CYAN|nr:hypothetical protein [Hyella patelloides]VEP15372.1 conserved exported hypothetical protein [Hyella patelloides LEGE 07179]
MKLTGYYLSLLSFSSFLMVVASSVTNSALAQCVQADVGVQYNISGSKEPTERSNDVDMQSDGDCRGNSSVTTGVQGNVGGNGRVRQERTVRHRSQGSEDDTGAGGSTVQVETNPQIDVYNPADNLR